MDIWAHLQCIHCIPNRSLLTIWSCHTNQEQAYQGVQILLNGGLVSEVPDHQLSRIVTCGRCSLCKVDLCIDQVVEKLYMEFRGVADKLENFDWYQWDSEVREGRYKEQNRKRWMREQERRIAQLSG